MSIDLVRIDNRPLNAGRGSHTAFLVVRNESSRIPYHLAYHRALGVDRFFFVDNGSEDGTLDLLLSQSDCHVFQTHASFADANYGMDWINALVERFGIGSWCLFLDADELFTYPHAETVSLPELCRFLDRTASEGMFTLLLDMYSRVSIAETAYEAGAPFLETCPYFDRDYTFRRRLGLSPNRTDLMETEAFGGPRLRRFYPEFRHAGIWRMALQRALRKLRRHRLGSALGLRRARLGNAIPPDLTKIPLLKGQAGRRWVSNHRCTPLALSQVTGTLLHFKFFSDFHDRSTAEAARQQHWDGGAEYVRYASLLNTEPNLSLFHEESCIYRSTRDLLRLGIVRSSPEFDGFAKRVEARSTQRSVVAARTFDPAPMQDDAHAASQTRIANSMGTVVPFPKRRAQP